MNKYSTMNGCRNVEINLGLKILVKNRDIVNANQN
jgi:hypothetical protein